MTDKTPELDKDGKPVVPGGDEYVPPSKEEYEKMVLELATKAHAEASLTKDLTDLRKKVAEIKNPKEGEATPPADVQKVVQEELAKKEAEQVRANYERVADSFLGSHPEFSKENDPGGVKFSAFKKALSRINLVPLKTVEDFEEAFQDAYNLMDRQGSAEPSVNPSSPRSTGRAPAVPPGARLPQGEAELLKRYYNGDVDAYLKAKAKKPAYFEELLKWVR
jgi:hypothetical protein